jgi:hypothetical protein
MLSSYNQPTRLNGAVTSFSSRCNSFPWRNYANRWRKQRRWWRRLSLRHRNENITWNKTKRPLVNLNVFICEVLGIRRKPSWSRRGFLQKLGRIADEPQLPDSASDLKLGIDYVCHVCRDQAGTEDWGGQCRLYVIGRRSNLMSYVQKTLAPEFR